MNNTQQKSTPFSSILVSVFGMILFAPLILRLTDSSFGSTDDYVVHTDLAAKMLADHTLLTPHPLLQSAIIILQQVLPIGFMTASAIVVLLSLAATTALLFKILYTAADSQFLAAVLSISLLVVAPFPAFFPSDHHLYLGYIGINVFHNPTMFLLKPLAILSFGFAVKARTVVDKHFSQSLAICVFTTLACALAKPSFTIVIVPSLALLLFSPTFRREISPSLILLGILLPSISVLGFQYWFTFSSQQLPGVLEGKSTVILAPLEVMSVFSAWLFPKLLLSILFPLSVFFCYPRSAIRSRHVTFAWACFVCGAAYTYLLAETGPRMFHGNFLWSAQISLFVLFVVSLEFLLHQKKLSSGKLLNPLYILCMTIFMLHVISGIGFYLAEYFSRKQYW
jgi:hypothetical protein